MFAYLDAGTGAMVVAAIAGGAAGVKVAARSFVGKFKGKKNASGTDVGTAGTGGDPTAVNASE